MSGVRRRKAGGRDQLLHLSPTHPLTHHPFTHSPITHSPTYPFTHSPTHPLTHHPLTHLPIHPLTHHPLTHLPIHPLTHHPLTHLPIHPLTHHPLTHSPTHPLTHSPAALSTASAEQTPGMTFLPLLLGNKEFSSWYTARLRNLLLITKEPIQAWWVWSGYTEAMPTLLRGLGRPSTASHWWRG